jgi:hypothetical protein
VTFTFEDSAATAAAQSGSSEVYRIDSDGFVETVRKFDREIVYAISGGETGSVLATGQERAHLRSARGRALADRLRAEKQVVSIDGNVISTTNTGAVYRMESRGAANPSSAARRRRRALLALRPVPHRGTQPRRGQRRDFLPQRQHAHARLDVELVDDAADLAGRKHRAPAAQFIQWKLTMQKAAQAAAIDSVTIAFVNRNVAPEIEGIAVADPAVVFITTAYPSAPQVVEATNPDEYGMFTSLDTPRDRTSAEQGKRMFRKGYRTVSWRASDDNNDTLRYTLSFRQKGSGKWLRLRENMLETQVNFDTSQLPDGRYELRLTASDEAGQSRAAADGREGRSRVPGRQLLAEDRGVAEQQRRHSARHRRAFTDR